MGTASGKEMATRQYQGGNDTGYNQPEAFSQVQSNEQQQSDVKTVNNAVSAIVDSVVRMQRRNEQLETSLQNRLMELDSYKGRVAKLNARHVKLDQRTTENIQSKNTQTEVETAFQKFYKDERRDAIEANKGIPKQITSNKDIPVDYFLDWLACQIFEASYEHMKEVKEAMSNIFKKISWQLVKHGPDMAQYSMKHPKQSISEVFMNQGAECDNPTGDTGTVREKTEYTYDAHEGLLLSSKEMAHKCNSDLFLEAVKKKVLKSCENGELWKLKSALTFKKILEDFQEYIKKCITLTWRMVTQVPPLEIDNQTFVFDKDHHERAQGKHPIAYTEEQNHLSDADVALHSRNHKLTVHESPITHPMSSGNEESGALDGKILLPSSNNGFKPVKWKTRKVSTMRKFAMRRAARKHKVLIDSSHVKRKHTASIVKDSKAKEAFVFHTTPPSSSKGVRYKTKIIKAPLKLSFIILPTEETSVIPPVDTAETESERVSKKDDTAEEKEGNSSRSNEDDSLPHGEPRVAGLEGSTTRHGGTSSIPHHNMPVRPGMQTSSGIRWQVTYGHAKLDDSKEGKRYKKKRKKSHSRTEDPTEDSADSGQSPAIVAGIITGILMLLFIFTGVPWLWRNCKRRSDHTR